MKRDISIDRLRTIAIKSPNYPSYFSEIQGLWQPINWSEYNQKVERFAKALMARGISEGTKVAILGYNKLEWLIAGLGTQMAGGISVGIYTSSSTEEVKYVVSHSEAEVLVVENLDRFERQVKPFLDKYEKLKIIVLMSEESCSNLLVKRFSEFLDLSNLTSDDELFERQNAIKPESIATMIYTSGTTGNPKSVMLSHSTVAWTVSQVVSLWQCNESDKAFSYLPLAHVAEQTITMYAPLFSGMTCYLVSSPDAFKDSLPKVQPSVFFGVPRVYEKIYEAIKTGLKQQSSLKQSIFEYFMKISRDYYDAAHSGAEPSFWTKFLHKVANRKIFLPLKEKIGFANARLCACGAAPISKDIISFFCGIDIPIYEVFGQSENCGPTTLNLPGNTKIGTVGKVIPGAHIKIADDGEILIKGPHVFSGYFKDEVATNETLKDGWLYSGDIGSIDKDGFLSITDRKKDILITAGGKNISPQNLESMLKHLPYVQSAVVVGDSRKYLCALFSPDLEAIVKKANTLGVNNNSIKNLLEHKEIHDEINHELAIINNKLAPVEQIKKYTLLPNEFSIVTGEFTPTLKVKRKFVNQKYQVEIDKLYQ